VIVPIQSEQHWKAAGETVAHFVCGIVAYATVPDANLEPAKNKLTQHRIPCPGCCRACALHGNFSMAAGGKKCRMTVRCMLNGSSLYVLAAYGLKVGHQYSRCQNSINVFWTPATTYMECKHDAPATKARLQTANKARALCTPKTVTAS
jgi:hypothetical protein